MTITLECAQLLGGRWLAEVPQLPGVQAYGTTRDAAAEQALAMLYQVLDDERRQGVQRGEALDVYGRESERRLGAAIDATLS
jgi:predicted RNase H-like HicB family nuclease